MNSKTANVLVPSNHVNSELPDINSSDNSSNISSKNIIIFKNSTDANIQETPLYSTSALFDIIYKSSNVARSSFEKSLCPPLEINSPLYHAPYSIKSNKGNQSLNLASSKNLIRPDNLPCTNEQLSTNELDINDMNNFKNSQSYYNDSPSQKSIRLSNMPYNRSENYVTNTTPSLHGSTNVPILQSNTVPDSVSNTNYNSCHASSNSCVFTSKCNHDNESLNSSLYTNSSHLQNSVDVLTTQKAVAFLAGPRERIYVLGNPIDYCLRCHQEGLGQTSWRPHRHIGELKIRYICERHFDDWESNHHIDIPLCPICSQVLYLYELNVMLGVSNARRLHKYVLKCASRHILPLLDLFCQTKKGGERCNANFKLQWCYGTMVKRCELQKNRDHDLWWVRYKNEWKQRRTVIRYKKDFLSHLTDAQRSSLLGLGLEGEAPPDPKLALGPTFDTLVATVGCSANGQKTRKRAIDKTISLCQIESCIGNMYSTQQKQSIPLMNENYDYNTFNYRCTKSGCENLVKKNEIEASNRNNTESIPENSFNSHFHNSLQYLEKYLLYSSPTDCNDKMKSIQTNNGQVVFYERQEPTVCDQLDSDFNITTSFEPKNINLNSIVTGTPTPPLASNNCFSVITSVVGNPLSS